jgi:hypothetical protein
MVSAAPKGRRLGSKNKPKDVSLTRVIAENRAYERDTLLSITGISRQLFEQMRRDGLPATKLGKKTWILGKYFLAWIDRQCTTTASTSSSQPDEN